VTDEHHLLLAYTNALPGREADFDAWWDEHHLPEVLAVPGMVRGQRFRYSAEQIRLPAGAPQPAPMPHFEHLTVYEIRGPLDVTLAGLKAGRESGEICSTDTLDPVANRGLLYTAHRRPLDAGR